MLTHTNKMTKKVTHKQKHKINLSYIQNKNTKTHTLPKKILKKGTRIKSQDLQTGKYTHTHTHTKTLTHIDRNTDTHKHTYNHIPQINIHMYIQNQSRQTNRYTQ